MFKTLKEAREMAEKYFAAEPAAVEIDFRMSFGNLWIGRDLQITDRPRFSSGN